MGWKDYQERNERRVQGLIESRGGTCEWPGCDLDEGLTWHHLIPGDKLFDVGGSRNSHSWPEIQRECAKCKVLCHGHHHMAEAYLILGEWAWPTQS